MESGFEDAARVSSSCTFCAGFHNAPFGFGKKGLQMESGFEDAARVSSSCTICAGFHVSIRYLKFMLIYFALCSCFISMVPLFELVCPRSLYFL
jgi:hypothetical protein